jgi:hypothetical protein
MAATSRAVSEAAIIEILERIEDGLTLKASCAVSGLGYANIVKRIGENEQLTKYYAHARESFVRFQVQRAHEIAADESIDVQRAKLMTDLIKWEASRTLPREYGERTALDVTTTNKLDSMTREELVVELRGIFRNGRMRLVPESQVIDAEAKQLGQGDD